MFDTTRVRKTCTLCAEAHVSCGHNDVPEFPAAAAVEPQVPVGPEVLTRVEDLVGSVAGPLARIAAALETLLASPVFAQAGPSSGPIERGPSVAPPDVQDASDDDGSGSEEASQSSQPGHDGGNPE
jgi:hypothetical protein